MYNNIPSTHSLSMFDILQNVSVLPNLTVSNIPNKDRYSENHDKMCVCLNRLLCRLNLGLLPLRHYTLNQHTFNLDVFRQLMH